MSADQWRLASQLGMKAGPSFRFIEWPVMRAAMPGVAGLVFMLCITSFTLVLTLGGGPRATTLEVAIYQALRFDFDPARAVTLTVLQIALTVAAVLAFSRLGANMAGEANLSVTTFRPPAAGRIESVANAVMLGAALLFVAGPLVATLLSGLQADLARLVGEAAVRNAVATSLVLALAASILSVSLALSLGGRTPGNCRHVSRTATVPAGTRDGYRRRLRAGRPADRHRRRLVRAGPAFRRCFRDRPGHGGGGQRGHGDAVRGARHPAEL